MWKKLRRGAARDEIAQGIDRNVSSDKSSCSVSHLHGVLKRDVKRLVIERFPVTELSPLESPSLTEIGVVLTDVMTFLPTLDLVELLSTSLVMHQWYDTCVEFRMAVAYADAPWRDEAAVREAREAEAAVERAFNTVYSGAAARIAQADAQRSGPSVHSADVFAHGVHFETIRHQITNAADGRGYADDAFRASLPRTRPRWDYCPIAFSQCTAGYIETEVLPPAHRDAVAVVPDVSYFNLRSLCCSSTMELLLKPTASATKTFGGGRADDITATGDRYDASRAITVGDFLLAGLVAQHVVIRSTGGIASIGNGFLRSTTAHTVTIAADRFTGANIVAPKSIGNGWLGDCPRLQRLDCKGLDYVESIGSRWLERNFMLESVSFTGLRRLRSVGESWLHSSKSLRHVDFSGLNALRTVDGWWMRDCPSLVHVSLKGLTRLEGTGYRFLEKCSSLQTVDLADVNPSMRHVLANGELRPYVDKYKKGSPQSAQGEDDDDEDYDDED